MYQRETYMQLYVGCVCRKHIGSGISTFLKRKIYFFSLDKNFFLDIFNRKLLYILIKHILLDQHNFFFYLVLFSFPYYSTGIG